MIKWIVLISLLFSPYLHAKEILSNTCDKCFTDQQFNEITSQIESLINSNEVLLKKAQELKRLQNALPELELDPLTIFVDKEGRVFVSDTLPGTLKIGDFSYSVSIKLKTTIVKASKKQYGFDLKFKAATIWSYELNQEENLKTFTSPALAIEPFYYKDASLNLLIGPRLYGPAIGIDITEHFGGLMGVGFKYNDEKAFFLGAAFDF